MKYGIQCSFELALYSQLMQSNVSYCHTCKWYINGMHTELLALQNNHKNCAKVRSMWQKEKSSRIMV